LSESILLSAKPRIGGLMMTPGWVRILLGRRSDLRILPPIAGRENPLETVLAVLA